MQTKFFKTAVAVFAFTLLVACGQETVEENQTPDVGEIPKQGIIQIENIEAVAPVTDIQMVEGTSAEKVEIYTDKAREAQTKLQLLLESNLLEVPETSFFENLIPTAFAADSTTEDQVVQLLAEIQTYTELAAEAATESTDPEAISELLSTVQETQTATVEILGEVSGAAVAAASEAIATTVAETMASIVEVDSANAEVAEAIESGAIEISVDIETDVEEFIEAGATAINLRDKIDPRQRAERKVQRALRELEKVKIKLIENEVPQEETDAILAEFKNQVEVAREFMANGDFKQAVQLAQAGKREINKIKNVVARARDAKGRVADLKILAEEGDAVAAEKLEKLQPLLAAGKEFKQILDERQGELQGFIEAAQVGRKELQKVRRGENADLLELKKLQATGEISKEDFTVQKDAILENAKTVRESKNQAQKELRAEKIDWLQELNGLPPEEIQAKKKEFEAEVQMREQTIRTDQKRLYDAVQSGNVETIQIVKDGIQSKQQQVRVEQREKVQQFVEQKMEALSLEKKEEIKQVRKDVQEKQQAVRDVKIEIREDFKENQGELREVKKDLDQAIQFGNKELIQGVKEEIRDNRGEVRGERRENQQDFREVKNELKDVSREFKDVIQEVKNEIKPPINQNSQQQNQPPKSSTGGGVVDSRNVVQPGGVSKPGIGGSSNQSPQNSGGVRNQPLQNLQNGKLPLR